MMRTDLLNNQVWLTVNGIVIGTKCMFKRKQILNGGVERFWARFVAKSFSQIFVLEYFGTYVYQIPSVSCMHWRCFCA